MTDKSESKIDWSVTSWKGSRLQQHQEFYALPFRRKLEVVEELNDFCEQIQGRGKSAHPPCADGKS